MKKIGSGGLACELELIVAEEFGGYANRKLYVIEGRPGLFRRLTAAAGKDDPDAVAAVFDGKLVHLKRQSAVENELSEAGYDSRIAGYATVIGRHPIITTDHDTPSRGDVNDQAGLADEGDIESTAEPVAATETYADDPGEVECDF